MNDNDIIKALECCNRPANQTSCDDCPYQFSDEKCSSKLIDDAIDLINRQKAENESLGESVRLQAEMLYDARAKAIMEFAERLKDAVDEPAEIDGEDIDFIIDIIDSLVKEMTEGKE